MGKRFFHTSLLLLILGSIQVSPILAVFGTTYPPANNFERAYTYGVNYGFCRFSHKLCISIQPSLYEYYHSKSHVVYGDSDYAKFVTPSVFTYIAEKIQNVTGNLPYSEEQFANAVLMLARQVPYVKSEVKYPVEAIIDNAGDCDVLSLLAASIMKAGGLDIVLLYYKGISPSHMNIGVFLPYTPVYRSWWLAPASFEYNNRTYWMAECTSMGQWKVGDRPELLAGIKPQVIPLENCEKASPGHVASGLTGFFEPSAISVATCFENVSTEEVGRTLTISGSILPACSGKSVTMYVNQEASSYTAFRTALTDEFGNYSFTWNFTSNGIYHVRTSLSGYANCSGSDSERLVVFTGFYRPSLPTETDYYLSAWSDDAFARSSVASLYAISVGQSSKTILQRNLTGAEVLLSGEFIVLGEEPESTVLKKETIVIPGYMQRVRLPGSGRYAAVHVPESVLMVPSEQPPLDWFGFVINDNGESNYTANVKVLNSNDAAQLTARLVENNTAFMNASISVRANIWYKVATKIIDSRKVAELYDLNGTLLQNVTGTGNILGFGGSGVLVSFNPEAVVVFKSLKAMVIEQPTSSVDADQTRAVDESEQLTPCIMLTVLLAVAVAAITCTKELRGASPKQALSS